MTAITPLSASGCPLGPPRGLLRTWLRHVRENRKLARRELARATRDSEVRQDAGTTTPAPHDERFTSV
jgi:hypothetical protein